MGPEMEIGEAKGCFPLIIPRRKKVWRKLGTMNLRLQ
jgi:hypothetical protein